MRGDAEYDISSNPVSVMDVTFLHGTDFGNGELPMVSVFYGCDDCGVASEANLVQEAVLFLADVDLFVASRDRERC